MRNLYNQILVCFLLIFSTYSIAQTATITGSILTPQGAPLTNVTIQIIGTGFNLTTSLDMEGNYVFENVPNESNIQTFKITKEDSPLNGVSSFDFVMGVMHILGIAPFDAPYMYLAMDLNKSGSITAFDLVQMRQLILGITTEFPNNDSWRFIEKAQLESITIMPPGNDSEDYEGDFSDTFTIVGLDSVTIDIIGIKIGDVNGNATP